ncbi:hypothetical protein CLF_101604 [Clonorchis sinensis]|uniref:EGF-like domain-containing protein n=1 Tax=Clonorchis sinensis TaxID=79923 RepID=G7Y648_CLOSI|nr:hypothetical protein CLF_101604 [Clonorchis sinensis]
MFPQHYTCVLLQLVFLFCYAEDAQLPVLDCYQVPCQNGGQCIGSSDNSTCKCPPGFAGFWCENPRQCGNGPCHPHVSSTSIQSTPSYKYGTCPSGWTGLNCDEDVDECSIGHRSPCEHDGVCMNTPGDFVCRCREGFTGARCEIEILECATSPCLNGGSCVEGIGNYQCICPPGFEGDNCEHEVNECAHTPCQNGGQCEDRIGSYLCHCLHGWTGPHCEERLTTCADFPCQNSAVCVNVTDVGFVCDCSEGFAGRTCELSEKDCDNLHCAGRTDCPDSPEDPGCQLCSWCEGILMKRSPVTDRVFTTGAVAADLTRQPCSKLNCKNGGTCYLNVCHCPDGFSGTQCEVLDDPCQSGPCLFGGSCLPNQTVMRGYICECQPGFEGIHCERNTYDCMHDACGAHGICIDGIDGYNCDCLYGSIGKHCVSIEMPEPSIPSADANINNDILIDTVQRPISSGVENVTGCSYTPCKNHAQCVPAADSGSIPVRRNLTQAYKCQCSTAIGLFEGEHCELDVDECAPSNEPGLCLNGAQCVNTYGSYYCRCPSGFYGRHCEHMIDACTYNRHPVCQNGGQCVSHGMTTQCNCPVGFAGPMCEVEINDCAERPCQNGGICLDHPGAYMCLCPDGFTGSNCETFANQTTITAHCISSATCSSQCLNGGEWIPRNGETGFCRCPFGFTGSQCEIHLNLCRLEPEPVQSSKLSPVQSEVVLRYQAAHRLTWELLSSVQRNLVLRAIQAAAHSVTASPARNADTKAHEWFLGLCHPAGTVQCVPHPGNFSCICRIGYGGRFCDQPKDLCRLAEGEFSEGYCQNGGVCENRIDTIVSLGTVQRTALAICHCSPGFGGPRCQYFDERCVVNPCRFGGTCHPNGPWMSGLLGSRQTPLYAPYVCLCPPGRAGLHCEVKSDSACLATIPLACEHNASCIVIDGNSTCNCPPGYCGERCELEAELCTTTSPSHNLTIPVEYDNHKVDPCLVFNCSEKANNGRCDTECNIGECGFDGHECLFVILEPLKPISYFKSTLLEEGTSPTLGEIEADLGLTPQPAKPWAQCSPVNHTGVTCALKFDDGVCDEECRDESCLFDGWDCEQYAVTPIQNNVQTDCPMNCLVDLDNDSCICNTSSPSSEASLISSTNTETLEGSLVLLIDAKPDDLLVNTSMRIETPLLSQLLSGLGELLRLDVHLDWPSTEQQPPIFPVHITTFENRTTVLGKHESDRKSTVSPDRVSTSFQRYRRHAKRELPGYRIKKDIIGSQIYLRLDAQSCHQRGGNCFAHVDKAAQFVAATMHRRDCDYLRPVLSVQSTSASIPAQHKWSTRPKFHPSVFDWFWSSSWLAIGLSALAVLLLLGVLLGVLFTAHQLQQQHQRSACSSNHRRSFTAYLHSIGKQRNAKRVQKAKIWYPENGLPDRVNNMPNRAPGYLTSSGLTTKKLMRSTLSYATAKPLSGLGDSVRASLLNYMTNERTVCDKHFYSETVESLALLKEQNNSTTVSTFMPSRNSASEMMSWNVKDFRRASGGTPVPPTEQLMENVDCPNAPSTTMGSMDDVVVRLGTSAPSGWVPNLSESYDDSGSTISTRMGGTGSEQDAQNEFLPESTGATDRNSDNWYFRQIAQRLISGSGLEDIPLDNESTTPVPSTTGTSCEYVSLRYLLNHLAKLDQDAFITQAYFYPGAAVSTRNSSPAPLSRLHRLLEQRLPETGETLLHLAARLNQAYAVVTLLDAGADPTSVDNTGRTVLLSSVCSGAFESTHALLSHPVAGSNPMCFVPSLLTDSTTPLIQAVKLSDFESFKLILHAMSILMCTIARNTATPLPTYGMTQSDHLSTSVTDQPTSVVPNERSFTKPFDLASSAPPHEDSATSLLDLNISDSLGRTALHWAAATDQVDFIQRLLEAGAACDVQTIYDETPLALAAKEGAYSACRLLLLAGANQESVDYLDRTPKILADQGGHSDVVQLLDAFSTASQINPTHQFNLPRNLDVAELYSRRFPSAPRGVTSSSVQEWSSYYGTSRNSTFSNIPSSGPGKCDANSSGLDRSKDHVRATTTTCSQNMRWNSGMEPEIPKHVLKNHIAQFVPGQDQTKKAFYLTDLRSMKREQTEETDTFPAVSQPHSSINTEATVVDKVDIKLPGQTTQMMNGELKEITPAQVSHKPDHRLVGDNHIMSSDSESPNRWSSSPSDSSPKPNCQQHRHHGLITSALVNSPNNNSLVRPKQPLSFDLVGAVAHGKSCVVLEPYAHTFPVKQY